jgi:multiple sugar transport system ATP-binding protein
MSFLELSALSKTFPDGTEAVKGIDLSCERGQFVVLLGPSGCGKTTTLRMIAGLERPTAGRVRIDGRDVSRLRPARRDVGFVFQFYGLYPHMTVAGNIAFPLECIGVRRRERRRRVAEVARRTGLERLLGRFPRQLSGGDQQRVALARSMVRRPAVYLMDEPLGTLDADRRIEMREYIRAQQLEMRVTTVYVTHDQEEAMSLADRVAVMHDGRILQAGEPMEVYDDPASLFVAEFVGSPGMNLLPGRADTVAGRTEFVSAGGAARVALGERRAEGAVTLGVRPEHLRADPAGPLTGKVVLDEYQGDFRCVHVDAGAAGKLVMRAGPGEAHGVGETVRLGFDASHARLFDGATGRRL